MVGYIASFWISNDFFHVWADICRIGSIIYLLIQGYFILNHAYLWNAQLVNAAGDDQCYAQFLLLGFSIFMMLLNLGWLIVQYIWYGGCGIGITVLVITTMFFIFFYAVSLLPLISEQCRDQYFRKDATIFVVGIATLYVESLSWSALASNPDEECNDMITSSVNTFMQILVGSIFCFMNLWAIAIAANDPQQKE